jgi:hypothetical protein
MKFFLKKMSILLLSFYSVTCFSTIDAYLELKIPYKMLQEDDICTYKTTMLASLGIPEMSTAQGLFNEVKIYSELEGYININLLSDIKLMNVDEHYDGHKIIYTFDLDFAAIRVKNGQSFEGRKKTITLAKLAIISILDHFVDYNGYQKSAFINLYNLPSQAGLPGTTVDSMTHYPYIKDGAFYMAFLNESINVTGYCPNEPIRISNDSDGNYTPRSAQHKEWKAVVGDLNCRYGAGMHHSVFKKLYKGYNFQLSGHYDYDIKNRIWFELSDNQHNTCYIRANKRYIKPIGF